MIRRAWFAAAWVPMLSFVLAAQDTAVHQRLSLVEDWSTSHLLFPGANSITLNPALIKDPRLLHAYLMSHREITQPRRDAMKSASLTRFPMAAAPVAVNRPMGMRTEGSRVLDNPTSDFQWRVLNRQPSSKIDWAVSLGPTAGMPPGETPAKFSFDVTATPDCTNDFVVYVINTTPAAGSQANIVAFNNLYSGTPAGSSFCGLADPTFLFSYAAGVGPISTSPVLSLDGTKIAFVDNDLSVNHAHFNVLTWAASQGTDATAGSVAPGTGGSSLSTLDFTPGNCSGHATASNASPFVDYTNDVAYVATDNGDLYKINGVFSSTPTFAYCITVNVNKNLTTPVYDPTSGNVFVSDGSLLYGFTPGVSSFTSIGSPIAVGSPVSHAVNQGTIIDSSNGWIYAFANSNSAGTNSSVAQISIDLSAATYGSMGDATTSNYVLNGQFDNQYWAGLAGGGHLYACGTQVGSGGLSPSLWGFGFKSIGGQMKATPFLSDFRGITTGTTHGSCSPLLELYDGTHDRLFVGVSGVDRITSWGIGAPLTSGSLATSTRNGQTGGTSAFSVDNFSSMNQASSIYFGTLGAGTTQCGSGNFCAVKLTQSTLQ